MQTETMQVTPVSEAEKQAVTLGQRVEAFVIITNEDRTEAEEIIQMAKKLEDEIFKYLDEPREKAYKDYQYHLKRLNDAITPVKYARTAMKRKTIAWDQEQERQRQAEQARLETEARKRAEDAALEAATQAEAEGDTETAKAIIEAPIEFAPVKVQKTSPAPSRLSAGRKKWYAEVTNIKALCEDVAKGTIPEAAVSANMPYLNSRASKEGSSLKIAGVIAKSKTI